MDCDTTEINLIASLIALVALGAGFLWGIIYQEHKDKSVGTEDDDK